MYIVLIRRVFLVQTDLSIYLADPILNGPLYLDESVSRNLTPTGRLLHRNTKRIILWRMSCKMD